MPLPLKRDFMKNLFRKLFLHPTDDGTEAEFFEKTSRLRSLYIGIPLRFAAITLITFFFSMGFKLVIEQGFFSRYKTALALLLAYYYVQIGLLGVYFIAVAIYFGICRRREKKLYLHLLYCTVAQALFVALTLLVYKTTSEDFYLWTFRITENIARLNATYKPPNMVPYILIFHALTYAVMFVEMPIGLLFEFLWKKISEKVDFGRLIHSFGGDRGDNNSALRDLSARTTGLKRHDHYDDE